MEITPRTIREVVFRERLRGYDEDHVDEFLERVATGVEIVQERLKQAVERAEAAERRSSDLVDGDDAMRRTLTLARRTADLAVEEAKEQAARIVEEANEQGRQIVDRARELARRQAVEAQEQLRRDLAQLQAAREQMRLDVAAFERYLDGERSRLRLALGDAIRWIEEGIPSLVPTPVTHDVSVPPHPGEAVDRAATAIDAPVEEAHGVEEAETDWADWADWVAASSEPAPAPEMAAWTDWAPKQPEGAQQPEPATEPEPAPAPEMAGWTTWVPRQPEPAPEPEPVAEPAPPPQPEPAAESEPAPAHDGFAVPQATQPPLDDVVQAHAEQEERGEHEQRGEGEEPVEQGTDATSSDSPPWYARRAWWRKSASPSGGGEPVHEGDDASQERGGAEAPGAKAGDGPYPQAAGPYDHAGRP